MKFSREIRSTGKIGTRPIEDRGGHERAVLKDTSLHQAYVCLNCEKKKCIGSEKCFAKEEKKCERRNKAAAVE